MKFISSKNFFYGLLCVCAPCEWRPPESMRCTNNASTITLQFQRTNKHFLVETSKVLAKTSFLSLAIKI